MMKEKIIAGLFSLPCMMTWAGSEAITEWGYQSEKAPQYWSQLDQKYQSCSGHNQSPINIEHTVSAQLAPLHFNYGSHVAKVTKLPHTVQASFHPGSELELDGERFELVQMHLHSPSENTIQGQSFPMELHLVHASKKGELAVVAVMYKQGKKNTAIDRLWKQHQQPKDLKLAARDFLPKQLSYYRFNGSLTTPPCTEGVRWLVLKDIQQVSQQQIEYFTRLMGYPNNRPVQEINGRTILE